MIKKCRFRSGCTLFAILQASSHMFTGSKFYRNESGYSICNTELNVLRKIICLRKSEVSVERLSVCNVTENLVEHGIYCLPCSYINDIINMLA